MGCSVQLRVFYLPGGWQDGALAQRFCDILSVRLCDSTVGPYTSKLNKFLAFCARQGTSVSLLQLRQFMNT
jgi:hypothetical protein